MKKFFGGIAAAVLLAANVPAMAAELPVKAPIIVPLFIWDGWYVGGNAGYS